MAKGKLKWRTTERRATTHRGVYVAMLSHDRSFAYGHLERHDGVYETLDNGLSLTLTDVEAASVQHAARQPAHPPMRGWPACGEIEALR